MALIQKIFLAVCGAFLLVNCAQMAPLDGGPKDVAAPMPDTSAMFPKHATTSIFPTKIVIPFDEFVRLNNAAANIIIVPEIKPKPTYKIKRKSLIIDLSEAQLDSNTTYAFYFNGAIKDITEGNDSIMNFVFSTGPVLDSLAHHVVVMDAEQGVPVAKVMVGLYPAHDTINPLKHPPKYFAQTDAKGQASFNYLSAGTFQLFGFASESGLLTPSKTDALVFKSDLLVIDTLTQTDTLFLFPSDYFRLQFSRKEIEAPGKITLVCTRPLDDAEIRVLKDSIPVEPVWIQRTIRQDSVQVWLNGQEGGAYQVSANWSDTSLTTRLVLRKSATAKPKAFRSNLKSDQLGIHDTLALFPPAPLSKIDTTLFRLWTKDSTVVPAQITLPDPYTISFLGEWEKEKEMQLTLFPGATADYLGNPQTDTLTFSFSRKSERRYANLELILRNAPSSPLILRAFNGKDLVAERTINAGDTLVQLNLLDPGSLQLQFVIDENGNGRWDNGSYPERRQPERCIWFREAIQLRANWDNTVTLEF
jgi:hypothetical protein